MTKLYVIEEPDQLIGKTIAHIEMNRFCDPLLLTTADGGIMAWRTYWEDDDDMQTDIFSSNMVEAHVFNTNTKKYLIENNICTQEEIDNFVAARIEERRFQQERWKKEKEERDKSEYERLKQKYEQEATRNTKTE